MDVEKTMQFLLQSHAQLEATQARHQEMLGALAGSMRELTGVVRELALAQMRTEERVQELARLQRDQSESLKQTRENLDTLIRIVDELTRRNGKH